MAEISGPASQSKRTDLGVLKQSTQVPPSTQPAQSYTGGSYGNNKAMSDQQSGAPLAGNPFANLPSLDMPTQRPNEPVTHGINHGDGAGTEVMRGMPNQAPALIDTIKHLTQFDSSGDAELIYRQLLDGDN
jgi:hypothetical protein